VKLGGSLERSRGRRRFRLTSGDGDGEGWEIRLDSRLLLIGGALVVGGWLVGYILSTRVLFPAPPPPGDLFEVPDLSGLTLATARERLVGSRLTLGAVDSLQHPSVSEALILGQSPLPGQIARAESPVRVTVSLGPQRREVPDVLSMDGDGARIVLQTSGFLVTVDSTESELPRGRVVAVTPPPDSVVPLPARVRIVVSTGPPLVMMPLVLGLEEQEAVVMLDSLGFVVSDVEEVFRFGRDQGIVVEQEPRSDTLLVRGTQIRLKIGRRGADGREQ